MSTVWESADYDKTTLLVLLSLADQASDEGRCWPSITTLSRRARCSRRHVLTILHKLEQAGWLTVDRRTGRSSVYTVAAPTGEPQITRDPEFTSEPQITREETAPVNPSSREGCTPVHGGGEPQITQNHKEPSGNRKGRKRPATAMPAGWQPSASNIQYAEENGIDWHHQLGQFVSHHRAKDSRFVDWSAAFRTWLGNKKEWSTPAPVAARVYVDESAYPGDPDDVQAYRAWYVAAANGDPR